MRDAVGAYWAVKYAALLCLCRWLQLVASALEEYQQKLELQIYIDT